MGCSWYTCLLTTNTASLYTAKPKHGRLIRILLCRCRYERDVNHDVPLNMCCSSPWREPAASHMVLSTILTSKTIRQVPGCTLLPLRTGRIELRSSPTSVLCLEIPVTLGHASVTIEEQHFLHSFIYVQYLYLALHPCRIKRHFLSWRLCIQWNTMTFPNFSLGAESLYITAESCGS